MLAEALDAEELEEYNQTLLTAIAFNSPKQLRRWKWRSIDKAGTRPITVKESKKGVANAIAGLAMGLTGGQMPKSDPKAYAKATGRTIVYRQPDGTLISETGEPIEARTPEMLIINGRPD